MAETKAPEPTPDEEALASSLRGGALARLLSAPPARYQLTRFAFLRLLGLIYFVAFAVAFSQGPPLIGAHGLMPADRFLEAVASYEGSRSAAFRALPTLFWLGFSDAGLRLVSAVGMAVSAAVTLGLTWAPAQLLLWALYLSIVQVGQIFYGYGWEQLLLETGFLSVFLCPLRRASPFASPVPRPVIWMLRWLLVRVMLGAGLIKLRGDECWRDLTCLIYHYETQPNPHPLSWLWNAMPPWFHKTGVLFNHLIELVAPLFYFGPRKARLAAGLATIGFQILLILSGNLSFLNWLTLVVAIGCLDDGLLERVMPGWLVAWAAGAPQEPGKPQRVAVWGLGLVVAALSIEPAANLLSPRQIMNGSFDPLHLVNTYGAFGSVQRERYEVIVEGTADASPGPESVWLPYELPCKPGDPKRAPCWVTPYHLRLDWQMWFAPMGDIRQSPWLVALVHKLLLGDKGVKPLFLRDPFPVEPPGAIRVELYRYHMTRPFDGSGAYWTRERVGSYLRPVSLADPALTRFLISAGLL